LVFDVCTWVAAPLKAQVARDAARGDLAPVEMDVPPHSQQEEVSPWSCRNVGCVANVLDIPLSLLGRMVEFYYCSLIHLEDLLTMK